jgi:hypothetical protein
VVKPYSSLQQRIVITFRHQSLNSSPMESNHAPDCFGTFRKNNLDLKREILRKDIIDIESNEQALFRQLHK